MMIRKLEYLIALAKEGHYGRAADACHISKPTLSVSLRHLEAQLGVAILKRGPRYRGLTERGERILAFAQRMAIECEHLHRDLESMDGAAFGTIRVALIASAVPIASKAMGIFRKGHPDVAIKITELGPVEIKQVLQGSEWDIAFTYLDDDTKRHGRNQSLYSERHGLLVSANSPLAHRKSISWSEALKTPRCLLTTDLHACNSPIRKILPRTDSTIANSETNSVTTLCAQIRSGYWTSILPWTVALESSKGTGLKCIPMPPCDRPPCVGIVIPHREQTSALAEAFLQAVISLQVESGIPKRAAR